MRAVHRLVGAVLGLVLAALGILAIAEGVVRLAGMDPLVGASMLADWLADLDLYSAVGIAILVALGIVGIVLILAGFARRRISSYDVISPDEFLRARIDRRGFERRLEHRVRRGTDATSCRVRIKRWKLTALIDVRPGDDAESVKGTVHAAIDAEQEALGMRRGLNTTVTVNAAATAASGRVE